MKSACLVKIIRKFVWNSAKVLKPMQKVYSSYSGSEFVVANTLTKWKKLEPNEINFSQGFSQKVVSTSCFVFNSLPTCGHICCLLITFPNSLDPGMAQKCPAWSGSKLFDTWMALEKSTIQWHNNKVWWNNKSNIWKFQKLIKIHFFANM